MPFKDPEAKRAYQSTYLRAYRAAHRAELRAYFKAWQAANPDKVKAYTQTWQERHPDRVKLLRQNQRRVLAAVRKGILVKPAACEECRTPGPLDAAHYDYDRPLDVRWLCRACHTAWDHAEPKSG